MNDDQKLLNRDDAPFSAEVWRMIDETASGIARARLSARRLLYTEGPYGLGTKAFFRADKEAELGVGGASVSAGAPTLFGYITSDFELSVRDVAAFQQTNATLDLSTLAGAAMSITEQEDSLIFYGSEALGFKGILNSHGVQKSEISDWKDLGKAVEDLIKAATKLDEAGFHGPYTLGLSPERYNMLFRRYEQAAMTELEHVKQIASAGVIKVPILKNEAVLIDAAPHFASILLGQDLAASFIGPGSGTYELTLTESIALRLNEPRAVCVIG